MPAGFWLGKLKVCDHLEDLGIDESMILIWILKRQDGAQIYVAQNVDS